MNVVDLIIIVMIVGAIARGFRVGMLRLSLSFIGFMVGLFIGSWLSKHIALHFYSPLTKLAIILAIELGSALILATAGELASLRITDRLTGFHLGRLNQVLGSLSQIILTLVLVWWASSALANIQSYDIGHAVRRSFIIKKLDALLPAPPDALAQLEKIISPNGFPDVFLGLEPQHTSISPTNNVDNRAIIGDEKSVVKIEGIGCGGIVNGSGFVVDPGVVVTDAHVVAGIRHPVIVDRKGTFAATTVWFDPDMDIAVLRAAGLTDPALPLAAQTLPNDNAAAVLGFPGGGPLVANQAVIIDHVSAVGRNIYNQGVVLRDVYEVQTDVEPGNSGGPLIGPEGSVAGVVFAKSLSQNNVGYALLINQVKPILQLAEQQSTPVSTNICARD